MFGELDLRIPSALDFATKRLRGLVPASNLPPGGGVTQLVTINASGAASVDFTTNIDGTYKNYFILGSNITTSIDAVNLWATIFAGSWLATNYNIVAVQAAENASAPTNNGSAAATQAVLNGAYQTSSTLPGQVEISFAQPNLSVQFVAAFKFIATGVAAALSSVVQGKFRHTSNTSPVTGIRLAPSSGTITGTFKLFGVN